MIHRDGAAKSPCGARHAGQIVEPHLGREFDCVMCPIERRGIHSAIGGIVDGVASSP